MKDTSRRFSQRQSCFSKPHRLQMQPSHWWSESLLVPHVEHLHPRHSCNPIRHSSFIAWLSRYSRSSSAQRLGRSAASGAGTPFARSRRPQRRSPLQRFQHCTGNLSNSRLPGCWDLANGLTLNRERRVDQPTKSRNRHAPLGGCSVVFGGSFGSRTMRTEGARAAQVQAVRVPWPSRSIRQ